MEWTRPLAEEGLDVWFQLWLDGIVAFVAAVLAMGLVVLVSSAIVSTCTSAPTARRRFWCSHAGREVEVEFTVRGLWRTPVAVQSCSTFEGGAAIECRRRCLDAAFRQQWEPALPIVRSSPPPRS